MHVAEGDGAGSAGERFCIRLVGDLGLDLEKLEHLFYVGQALADFAIDETDEVQRHRKLQQKGIDEHEIADGLFTALHGQRRHHHHYRGADTEDHALAEVQPAERGPDRDRRFFVTLHGDIEAFRLHLFIAEIFDGLEIQERVDRLGIGVGIAVVHGAANADTPVAGPDGEPDIGPDGDDRDQHIGKAVGRPEDDRRQQEFNEGWRGVENGEADNGFDALGAAFDNPRKPAGLALQMEAQGKPVHVHEGSVGELAHRMLADACKQ